MNQVSPEAKLTHKVALVTGAARSLGRAIALRLSRDGAAVAIHFRTHAELAETLAAQIRAEGRSAFLVQGDVSDPEEAKSIVSQVASHLGSIDILVNNAAVFYRGDLEDLNDSDMEKLWRTNVAGPIYFTQLVAKGMKERRFGRIVNLTSVAAVGTSATGTDFYSATKAAIVTLTRRFAMELGPYGITVNSVAPGWIPTEMALEGKTGEKAQEAFNFFAQRAMVGRVGTPEEIAHAVAFFVSPEAGFITAQNLHVDGGRMDFIGHP